MAQSINKYFLQGILCSLSDGSFHFNQSHKHRFEVITELDLIVLHMRNIWLPQHYQRIIY